jgi:hypothetical protein
LRVSSDGRSHSASSKIYIANNPANPNADFHAIPFAHAFTSPNSNPDSDSHKYCDHHSDTHATAPAGD